VPLVKSALTETLLQPDGRKGDWNRKIVSGDRAAFAEDALLHLVSF
jgi:hypothetical protein